MKIALVCPASLPATQFGGILFLAVDIADELSRKGHDITIYTTDLDFANNPHTFNKNLPNHEKVGDFFISRSHVWFHIKLFFVNPGIFFQLKKDKPELIHTIGIRSFQSFIAALVAKKLKIPLIVSDQGGLTTHPDLNTGSFFQKIFYKIQQPMIKFVINTASKISVPNNYEAKIFEDFIGKDKITIIRNGINLEKINTHELDFRKKFNINEKYILFLGRFHKVKGVDTLIHAINLIKNELTEIKFLILGVDFGYEKEMIKLISDLKLDKKISVFKNPSRSDVFGAYQECEFLVLPSRWELSPLTPLEGFSFKKTVISTTAHGIPHTITDQENCILVEPENAVELSKAITFLINNVEKRKQLANNGYNLVNTECNSKVMAEKTLMMYQEVLQNYNN